MISPESWGFSSIPQLANVGIVFAREVCYMGTTLAHTHAILMPTCAATNIGTVVAPHARLVPTCAASRVGTDVATHAKPMPTMGSAKVGTLVATQESCQLSDKCWHGGGCWLVLTIVVATQTQNRWKLGILPRVLTTVSHWLALWLQLVAQQRKNSLTFV